MRRNALDKGASYLWKATFYFADDAMEKWSGALSDQIKVFLIAKCSALLAQYTRVEYAGRSEREALIRSQRLR